jgi:hypothetical protein
MFTDFTNWMPDVQNTEKCVDLFIVLQMKDKISVLKR